MEGARTMVPELRFRKEDGTEFPEWESVLFGSVMTVLPNNALSRDELTYGTGGIENIHYGDVLVKFGASLDVSKTCLPFVVTPQKIRNVPEALLRDGDIVIADTSEDSTVGKATEITGCNDCLVVSGLHTIPCRPKKKYFVLGFLGYFINSTAYHDQLKPLMQGTKVISISKKAVQEGTILFVPCIEEQQIIVTFLSDLDTVISAAEAEVVTLKQMKRGMMQKIFSQEVRFRRVDGTEYPKWKTNLFSSVMTILPNNTLSRDELTYDIGGIKNIHYGDVLMKFGASIDVSLARLPFVATPHKIRNVSEALLRDGDIVIADTAENSTVGKATEITGCNDSLVISGLHTIPCRPKENYFSLGFLGYYINSTSYHDQLRPLMQGTKVTSINKKTVQEGTILSVPCIEEQQKITSFLSDLDAVISTAEAEVEVLKQMKKGMMQKIFSREVKNDGAGTKIQEG